MKTFLLVILMFSTIAAKSQDYTPFDFTNGIWITNYHEYEGPTYDFQYYCDGDTVINNQSYHKLYQYTIKLWYIWERYLGYYGAIRNDTANRKVMLIENGQSEPEILYDFNLEIGDTIKEGIGKDFILEVVDVDSILVCNKYHKRYVVQDIGRYREDQAFVEGIGYSFGFVEPLVIDPFETTSELVCYTEINNEACEECKLLLTNENRIKQKDILVYPNPVNGTIFLELNEQNMGPLRLLIYNNLGQLIKDQTINPSMNVEISFKRYPSGSYIFYLTNIKGEKRYSGKFIVEK